ncbi:MAG: glycosyltransferase [Gemmataceae bacterium]|nr:glycosyltransferase [Gemmataceae bacterium]
MKTRLASAIGPESAARLYRDWIGQVLHQVQPLRPRIRVVALYDGAPLDAFAPWRALAEQWHPQVAGDLGTRLMAAFETLQHPTEHRHHWASPTHAKDPAERVPLAPSSSALPSSLPPRTEVPLTPAAAVPSDLQHRPVCVIGTDCLEIDAPLLERAFDLLQSHDVVVGPTTDGGYYLIGSATFRPLLFRHIRWSSPWTLTDQLQQCQRLGCSVAFLPLRSDIDTLDDWHAYCQRTTCCKPLSSS